MVHVTSLVTVLVQQVENDSEIIDTLVTPVIIQLLHLHAEDQTVVVDKGNTAVNEST